MVSQKMVLKLEIFSVIMVMYSVLAVAAIRDIDLHAIPAPKQKGILEDFLKSITKYDGLSPVNEREPSYWRNAAAETIRKRNPKAPLNLNKAKNIIMFLGDGMSLTTVTAARILKGQRQGRKGENEELNFEKFPFSGLSKTYCANAQVADSACTATSYLCGVKSNFFQIGLNAKVNFNNCSAAMNPANHVSSLAAWAQAAGKSTGILTTTTLTHASPSGAYAHVANRLWECDADVRSLGENPRKCMDIAQQLITQAPGRNFDVMLGGGMGKFLPKWKLDSHGNRGEREDNKNLLSQWQRRHPCGLVVTNRAQLMAVNASAKLPTSLMGVFQSGLMKFHSEGDPNQPTLAEMTETALKILSQNENGYFVFIEGGLIDLGNHANKAGLSLDETLEMDKAVQKALEMTNSSETLIIVTADHGHPLSISGYPGRGNDILNLNEINKDVNDVKYATLNYAVGTNQYLDEKGQRIDLTGKFGSPDFIFPSYIHGKSGVHGGDDVGVYASGPYAHLFSGSIEQNVIPMAMAYASCIGNGPTMCNSDTD